VYVELDGKWQVSRLVKILCDTGALSANYVAADLIKSLETRLDNSRFFGTRCKVTLADSRTTQSITRGVRLNLVLKDSKAKKYAYSDDFFVIDMKKNKIIIGLPALTGKLYPFLQALLDKAHSDYTEKGEEDIELHNMTQESVRQYPWTKLKDVIAPEDEDCELPVNFGDAIQFLGKSREQAIEEYDTRY
jgi:hypothetical protein